jgi:hypothetical protein
MVIFEQVLRDLIVAASLFENRVFLLRAPRVPAEHMSTNVVAPHATTDTESGTPAFGTQLQVWNGSDYSTIAGVGDITGANTSVAGDNAFSEISHRRVGVLTLRATENLIAFSTVSGKYQFENLLPFASDAEAGTGGVTAGMIYKHSDGAVYVKA